MNDKGTMTNRRSTSWKKIAMVALLTVGWGAIGWGNPEEVGAEEDLSGTYLLFQQTTTLTELPVVKDIVARTRSVVLVQLTQEDGRLSGTGRLCDLEIRSSSKLVKTSLPDGLRDLLARVPFDAKLTKGKQGSSLVQQSPTLVLGAKLKDPERDALPTNDDDKRIIDQDHDGHPGVTVEVSGFVSGKVYVVQRSSSLLRGERTQDGFRGPIEFRNEQSVIGASSPLLKRDPGGRPVPDKSYFVLARLPSRASCSDAVRASASYP